MMTIPETQFSKEDDEWLNSLPELSEDDDGELGITTVVFYRKPPRPAKKAAGKSPAPAPKPGKPRRTKPKP